MQLQGFRGSAVTYKVRVHHEAHRGPLGERPWHLALLAASLFFSWKATLIGVLPLLLRRVWSKQLLTQRLQPWGLLTLPQADLVQQGSLIAEIGAPVCAVLGFWPGSIALALAAPLLYCIGSLHGGQQEARFHHV